jgi:hypothetical protein
MNRFWTVTLEVDVTFRVILDRDDACKRSILPEVDRSQDVFHLPTKKSPDKDRWGRVADVNRFPAKKIDVVKSSCTYDPIYLVL